MFSSHNVVYSDTINFNLHNFKPLRTAWIASIHTLLTISIGTLIIVALIYNKDTGISRRFLFCQAALWSISFIFYLGYASKHHNLKLGGHFVLYKQMQNIGLSLLIIPSFFSSVILFAMAILREIYHANSLNDRTYETILYHIVTLGILIEVLIETVILIIYQVLTKKFNRLKPLPDVEQYEYHLPCDGRLSSEIGYRLEGEAVADLLEKQADLLCYYKATIVDLKSKLADLTTGVH